MPKKRRTRAEVSERHLARTVTKKKDQHDGTSPTDKEVATTPGLIKTFLTAAQLLIVFIFVFFLFIRLMSWLSIFEWSKSRCQLLSPSSLKMADLKSLLEERGHNASQLSTQEDLEEAVLETGGVMEIEMEPFLEAGDNSVKFSRWNAERFETWDELKESFPQKTIGVYLILCSAELERSTSELIPWRQFLHRLSKHGVKFVFVGCDDDGDCVTPKVALLPIWTFKGYINWSSSSYVGPMQPSDIFQWITKTLSANVLRSNNATDVLRHPDRSTLSIVTHSTRPLPLSYAVLASEFTGRVLFFWVDALDEYLPDRACLMVLGPVSHVVYDKGRFLNQREIRWMVRMIAMDRDDFCEIVSWLAVVFAMTIPLVAEGSAWETVKVMLWFLLACVLEVVLFATFDVPRYREKKRTVQFAAEMFAALIRRFRTDLLLLFHLFSEYPLMQGLVFPVYALMSVSSARIIQFDKDVDVFIINLFTALKNFVSQKPESVTTVPTTTSTQMLSRVAKTTAQLTSNITKPMVKVPVSAAKTIVKIASNIAMAANNVLPLDAAKTIANIASSVYKANIQLPKDVSKTMPKMPCDVTVATSGAGGYETNDSSAPKQRLKSVAKSKSLQRESSSPSAGPHHQDPATFPSASKGTIRACSTNKPFEYPHLVDWTNGDLDKATTKQMARVKIQKIWLQPIISDMELRLSTALQKSEARDPRSFEKASRTVPHCFYCKAVFQPTSEVRVLACREIFHPWCMDEWMKEGNIDCPICQYYAKDRMFLS